MLNLFQGDEGGRKRSSGGQALRQSRASGRSHERERGGRTLRPLGAWLLNFPSLNDSHFITYVVQQVLVDSVVWLMQGVYLQV